MNLTHKIKVLWTNFPPWVTSHDFEKCSGVLPSMMDTIGIIYIIQENVGVVDGTYPLLFVGEHIGFGTHYKKCDFICGGKHSTPYKTIYEKMREENATIYMGFCHDSGLAQQLFDATIPILDDSILWVAPKLKQGQGWSVIMQFFTLSNWLLSMFVLIITALAFRYFATKAGEDDRKYRKMSQCLLFIYSCFFNMGNSILPKDAKLRIICLSLGPFALNISAYLQGKLVGALTHPIYTERDGSFEELQNNIPLVIQEYMLTLLQISKTNISYNFSKSNRSLMQFDLQDVVKLQDRATIINKELLNDHSHFMSYIQTNEIIKYKVVLYVMKNDGLYELINDTIKKFVEHGFIKKIISDVKYMHVLQCYQYMNCWDANTQVFILTIPHLKGAFFVLIFGLAVAVVLFLIELLWSAIKYKQ